MSDNGGEENWYPEKETNIKLYDGKHGPYQKLGNNLPLKGYKTELFEGGVRVPALFYWKNHLKNTKVEQLLKITDILPTLISLIDEEGSKNLNLDGNNMWDFISGKKSEIEDRIVYLRTGEQFSLRDGDWKLIHYGKTLVEGKEELYNINNDPNENCNVLNENLQIRNELFDLLMNQVKLDPAE
jgi:arylsulfatase A-like enzyme